MHPPPQPPGSAADMGQSALNLQISRANDSSKAATFGKFSVIVSGFQRFSIFHFHFIKTHRLNNFCYFGLFVDHCLLLDCYSLLGEIKRKKKKKKSKHVGGPIVFVEHIKLHRLSKNPIY